MKLALSLLTAAVLAGGPSLADTASGTPQRRSTATTPARTGHRATPTRPSTTRNRATPARPAQNRAATSRGGQGTRAAPGRETPHRRAQETRATPPGRATTRRRAQETRGSSANRATSSRDAETGASTAVSKSGGKQGYEDTNMNSDSYDENKAAKFKAQQNSKSSGKKAAPAPSKDDSPVTDGPDMYEAGGE